jgi:hypothetical protein
VCNVDFFLAVTDKVCAEVTEYQFKNVGELEWDYRRGARGVYAGLWGGQPDVVALIPVVSRPLRDGEVNLIKG